MKNGASGPGCLVILINFINTLKKSTFFKKLELKVHIMGSFRNLVMFCCFVEFNSCLENYEVPNTRVKIYATIIMLFLYRKPRLTPIVFVCRRRTVEQKVRGCGVPAPTSYRDGREVVGP